MLTQIKAIEALDLTQENPCFVIESDDTCVLHVHVYRKGSKNERKAGYCWMDRDMADYLIVGTSDCELGPCNDRGIMFETECKYHEEWHDVEGSFKKVCLTQQAFCARDGVWSIDVYRDFEYLDDSHAKADPQNLYRREQGCTRIGKELCKQYEYYVGKPCDDLEVTPCNNNFMD